MVDEYFERRVREWLVDNPSRAQKFVRSVRAYRHNSTAKPLRWSAAHWVSRTGIASSAPAIAYFSGNTLSPLLAGTLFCALFAGNTLVSYLGQRASGRKRGPNPTTIDAMVRIGDILSSKSVARAKPQEKQAGIEAALGLLEVLAREVTCRPKGEISVSLATYEGNSKANMCLRFRNPGSDRPRIRTFDGSDFLAHRACQAGSTPKVVHDLATFGGKAMKSPTQATLNYRSILIFPLRGQRSGVEKVIGFLSIDASTPYSFFGNRADIIVINSQPIITHIQALL